MVTEGHHSYWRWTRLTGQYLIFNQSLNILADTLMFSLTRYFCQQQPNGWAILSNTHSRAPEHTNSTFTCSIKKKKIYWTVTAFSNNPRWERAVRRQLWQKKSRHTIESKSFSGKMEYNHGAFCQLYTARKEADMQVSQKVLVSFSYRIAEVTKALRRNWLGGLDRHKQY